MYAYIMDMDILAINYSLPSISISRNQLECIPHTSQKVVSNCKIWNNLAFMLWFWFMLWLGGEKRINEWITNKERNRKSEVKNFKWKNLWNLYLKIFFYNQQTTRRESRIKRIVYTQSWYKWRQSWWYSSLYAKFFWWRKKMFFKVFHQNDIHLTILLLKYV